MIDSPQIFVSYMDAHPVSPMIKAFELWYGGNSDVFRHLVVSISLTAGLWLLTKRRHLVWILLFVFSLGMVEELRQHFFKNPFTLDDVFDIASNCLGMLLGALFAASVFRLRSNPPHDVRKRHQWLVASFAVLSFISISTFPIATPIDAAIRYRSSPGGALLTIPSGTYTFPVKSSTYANQWQEFVAGKEGYYPIVSRVRSGGKGIVHVDIRLIPREVSRYPANP